MVNITFHSKNQYTTYSVLSHVDFIEVKENHSFCSQFNMAIKRILNCGKYEKEERISSTITQSSLASKASFQRKNQSHKIVLKNG